MAGAGKGPGGSETRLQGQEWQARLVPEGARGCAPASELLVPGSKDSWAFSSQWVAEDELCVCVRACARVQGGCRGR